MPAKPSPPPTYTWMRVRDKATGHEYDVAAGAFDEIIIREDTNLRGRAPGETAALVLEGIRAAQAAGAGPLPRPANGATRPASNQAAQIAQMRSRF